MPEARRFTHRHTTERIEAEDYGVEEGGVIEVRRMTPQDVAYMAMHIFRENWDFYDGDTVDELVAHAVACLSPEERVEFDAEVRNLVAEYEAEQED